MQQTSSIGQSGEPVGSSDRQRLARVARAAMLGVPGVITTDTGPAGLHTTTDGDERLEGIICAANIHGGYDVSIRLIAGLVSLPDLSDQVTAAIYLAAARVGVPCNSVAVHFADVIQSGVS